MNSQHFKTMKVLSRTTSSIEDAFDSLDADGYNLAVTSEGEKLPFYSKLYITPAKVSGYFNIREWSEYEVKIFVFEDHEEQVNFMLKEQI
tara:strand:+ start:278 stop:547 length:270 start_codon:yes stop_codon:yes gene_type:complete